MSASDDRNLKTRVC